jgi:hypothetical protein
MADQSRAMVVSRFSRKGCANGKSGKCYGFLDRCIEGLPSPNRLPGTPQSDSHRNIARRTSVALAFMPQEEWPKPFAFLSCIVDRESALVISPSPSPLESR